MKALLGKQDTSSFTESTGDISVGNGTAIVAVGTGALGHWLVRMCGLLLYSWEER